MNIRVKRIHRAAMYLKGDLIRRSASRNTCQKEVGTNWPINSGGNRKWRRKGGRRVHPTDGTGAQTVKKGLSADPISHYLAAAPVVTSRKFSLRHLIQTFKAPLGI